MDDEEQEVINPGKAKTKNETDLEMVKVEEMGKILNKALGTGGDVVKELLRAAMVNPLIGLVVALIISDMLEKSKVILPETGILIKTLIVATAGVDLAGDIIARILRVLPFAPVAAKNNELFTPSASTIVFSDSNEDLSALLSRLGKK